MSSLRATLVRWWAGVKAGEVSDFRFPISDSLFF